MDIDKMIHALKLAKDCTYADVMTEGAKEFLRMKIDEALKQEQESPIDSASKCYSEKDIDNAYDKGFNDGNQRDLTGSLIEVL
jgi:hypothetical protein